MARKASIGQARALRRSAPSIEQFLWKLLRDRKLSDLKFRRQVPIGPYVVDFICLRHRLIIEADGPFHDPKHDRRRDDWLVAQGFRVLRFSNSEIGSGETRVMAKILTAVGRPPLVGEF
jgi:very-short-patch-repair endonuclease